MGLSSVVASIDDSSEPAAQTSPTATAAPPPSIDIANMICGVGAAERAVLPMTKIHDLGGGDGEAFMIDMVG